MLFVLLALFSFIVYLVLTAGSGSIGYWSASELLVGAFFAVVVGFVSRAFFSKQKIELSTAFLNPVRWIYFFVYLVYFFFAMAKANFDVAFRVITGKIRPGIVRIKPGLKTTLGTVMLANSITLTPGTLSVEIDGKDLHIHCLNLKSKKPELKEVCGNFSQWIRRITE